MSRNIFCLAARVFTAVERETEGSFCFVPLGSSGTAVIDIKLAATTIKIGWVDTP